MVTATSHACMYAIHEDTGKISHDVYGYHVNKALRIACFFLPTSADASCTIERYIKPCRRRQVDLHCGYKWRFV